MAIMNYHFVRYDELLVDGTLPMEGTLLGKEGEFQFKMLDDGLAVYNSSLLDSGFGPPARGSIYVPKTVNGIPIVELHQNVDRDRAMDLFIDAFNLKRIYLTIGDYSHHEDGKGSDDSLERLISIMMRYYEAPDQKDTDEIGINLHTQAGHVEYCRIKCDRKCILNLPSATEVCIDAPEIVIKSVPCCVKKARFTGRVYPDKYDYFGDLVIHNDCFAGNSELDLIEGTLYEENGWIFSNCKSLKQVHLGNGMKKIPPHAFENCVLLSDLYIPDTVTEIGAYAFSGCTGLKTIHLPSNIKRIPEGAFMGCSSLRKCFLSDSIEEIESKAFAGCTSLTKPWIPKNIKTIAEDAFDNPSWYKY